MRRKELERGVAALRRAESDIAMREKNRRDDASMFQIGINLHFLDTRLVVYYNNCICTVEVLCPRACGHGFCSGEGFDVGR